MSIKILLGDDHKLFLQGLRSLLQDQADLQVVGEAYNGRDAVKLTRTLLPDVVIMDIAMADLNGFEATRQIIAEAPSVKVVALSMHSDSHFVREMLRAGALGYVLKCAPLEELVTAIRAVVAKQIYLSPGISRGVVKEYLQYVAKSDSGKLFQTNLVFKLCWFDRLKVGTNRLLIAGHAFNSILFRQDRHKSEKWVRYSSGAQFKIN